MCSHCRLPDQHYIVYNAHIHVMRSKEISLQSNMTFSVFYLIEVLIWREVYFAENPN